jgi:hypothetical protein
MRWVLAQLETISTIPSVNYNATHSTDEHPGGRKPPGDYGYRTYAEWYGPPFHEQTPASCRSDRDRETCVAAAEKELKHLRKGESVETEPEPPEETRLRLLEETEGWSLQDVARSHWRVNATVLRRLRVADGRDSEYGRPVELSNGLDLASRAREMRDNGMTLRAITMALGLRDKVQVQRLLKKVA